MLGLTRVGVDTATPPRPALPDDHGRRHGNDLRSLDGDRHGAGRPAGRRRRIGAGEHDAAGRRLDRRGSAEHLLGDRGDELRHLARRPSAGTVSQAAVHGYTTAFWWAAGIFFAGAIFSSLLLRSGAQELDPAGAPVLAH